MSTACCSKDPINVAGMVIHVTPARKDEVIAALAGLEGVDVHATTEDWRIVATAIDTGSVMAIDQLAAMNRIPGVVSAMLAYHQIDHPDAGDGAACSCASAQPHIHSLPERA